MFRSAYRSSSGAPNCIYSLWFTYACGDRPLSSQALMCVADCTPLNFVDLLCKQVHNIFIITTDFRDKKQIHKTDSVCIT